MVIKNAFYEISGQVYFVNRVVVDCDKEYRFYIRKAEKNPLNVSQKYISYCVNTYNILDEEREVFFDFFTNAIYLNDMCCGCVYYDNIDIDVALYPKSGPEDENVRYALCLLRRKMNYGGKRQCESRDRGDRYYSELYCNCQFKDESKTREYLKKMHLCNKQEQIEIRDSLKRHFVLHHPELTELKKNQYSFKNLMINPYQLEYLASSIPPSTRLFCTYGFAIVDPLYNIRLLDNYIEELWWCNAQDMTVPLYNSLSQRSYVCLFPEGGQWLVVDLEKEGLCYSGPQEIADRLRKLEPED